MEVVMVRSVRIEEMCRNKCEGGSLKKRRRSSVSASTQNTAEHEY